MFYKLYQWFTGRCSQTLRGAKAELYVGLGLGLLVMMLSCSVVRGEQGPMESWLTASIAQRLDYGLEFKLESESRFSDEANPWRRLELTPQVIWHYSPRYDFGAGYENNWQESTAGELSQGHEGFIFATLKLGLRDWNFFSRQRLQFGVVESEEVGVFRHEVTVVYEGKRLPFGLKPFVSNEYFFDLFFGELSDNRVRVGLRYDINEHVSTEVYGMRVDRWSGDDEHQWSPVLGVTVSLEF